MQTVSRQEFIARFVSLERKVEADKLLIRQLIEQAAGNADGLAAIRSRLDRIEQRLDRLDGELLLRPAPSHGGLAERMRARRPKEAAHRQLGASCSLRATGDV